MKIKIEEAKKRDFNQIIKLQMGLADFHKKIDSKYYKSGKERRKHLEKRLNKFFSKKRKNQKFFVAKVKDKIIGFLNIGIHKPHFYCRERKIGELGQMYVDKKFRRKRIGELLFKEVKNWFKKRKIKFIEILVDSRNQIGISAYKKYGFFEFQKRMRLDL
ncbi:MAG: GNAT family N-acetyltransferase [Minisyncoccia bacterium]